MSHYSPTQIEELTALGHHLRQQREERSLTLEAVAEATFVRLPLLEALETGNSDRLPEAVYVQGFIRRYGDFLGLNGTELSQSLSRGPAVTADQITPTLVALSPAPDAKELPASSREKMGKSPKKSRSSQPIPLEASHRAHPLSKLKSYWIYALALGAAIAGLYHFFPRPTVSPIATAPPANSSTHDSTDHSTVPEPVSPPNPSPIVPSSPLEAKVNLLGDAWLKVEADGQKVYEGILLKGEQKTWTAQKALNIRSGNAGAVSLSVNQQPPKPLGPLGKIADITLTPESPQF